MIKNILNFIGQTYKTVNDYGFDIIDPHVVRYFRNEYGKDWRSALTEHLYKKEISKQYTVSIAYNKGAYQVIPKNEVKDIGK